MLMSFIGTFPNALILIDIDRDDEMLADKPSVKHATSGSEVLYSEIFHGKLQMA